MVKITKASSKGQVVIPEDIRKRLKIQKGSIFVITSKKEMIVLRKLDTKMTKADLRTLKAVEDAWKDMEHGKYKVLNVNEFSQELSEW